MNVPPELETLRDWLRFSVSRFTQAGLSFGHGFANAHDEASYLLLHTLHLPLDRLELFLDAKLTHAERNELAALLPRRIEERVPAAYLTREAWLGELRFHVDEVEGTRIQRLTVRFEPSETEAAAAENAG